MNPNMDLPGMEAYRSSQVNPSPNVLVIAFDPFLPPARIPVPVGGDEDPSKGPYVLAFRDEESWRQAWKTCKEKIATQCEAGANLGCSASAAIACRQPWWKSFIPFLGSGFDDQFRRQNCEAREMRGCLLSSHERCSTFARDTCDPVYANMRIAVPGAPIDSCFSGRSKVSTHDELPSLATRPYNSKPADLGKESFKLPPTTFQGRELMQREQGRL